MATGESWKIVQNFLPNLQILEIFKVGMASAGKKWRKLLSLLI